MTIKLMNIILESEDSLTPILKLLIHGYNSDHF